MQDFLLGGGGYITTEISPWSYILKYETFWRKKNMRKHVLYALLIIGAGLLLAGCAPAETIIQTVEVPVVETQVVVEEVTVVETQIVEVEVEAPGRAHGSR